MTRKSIILIISGVFTLAVIVGAIYMYIQHGDNTLINRSTPKDTVVSLIKTKYFDQGTYDDYRRLYSNNEHMDNKKTFDTYRKNNVPKDLFDEDYESVQSVQNHLKVKQIDANNAEVYWVPDPKQADFTGGKYFWILEKTWWGKWLLD